MTSENIALVSGQPPRFAAVLSLQFIREIVGNFFFILRKGVLLFRNLMNGFAVGEREFNLSIGAVSVHRERLGDWRHRRGSSLIRIFFGKGGGRRQSDWKYSFYRENTFC